MRAHVKAYDNADEARKHAASKRAARRSHFSAADRARFERLLRERDGRRCFYCHVPLAAEFHLDHVRPLIKGGKDDPSNLVLACLQCNQEKHNKTIEEYRAWPRRNQLPVRF